MSDQRFPPGWPEERVQRLIDHYESLTEEEQLAEDEAAVAEQHDRVVSEAEVIIRDVRRAFQNVAPGPLSLGRFRNQMRQLSRGNLCDVV